MSTSDKVLIGSTLTLAVVALVTPFLSELAKRKLFKPLLNINFKETPPACHQTNYNLDPKKPAYYFRFEVRNTGKSTSRNVENSLENVWTIDSNGQHTRVEDFTPINLKWSLNHKLLLQNINPGRKLYCNIGHLNQKKYEEATGKLINPIGYKGKDLRFALDLVINLNAQLNCLPPGTYILQINTYAENHKTLINYIKIVWSGIWKDDLNLMFKELRITKTKEPVKHK
jgi:hypothetical protein